MPFHNEMKTKGKKELICRFKIRCTAANFLVTAKCAILEKRIN